MVRLVQGKRSQWKVYVPHQNYEESHLTPLLISLDILPKWPAMSGTQQTEDLDALCVRYLQVFVTFFLLYLNSYVPVYPLV